MRHANHGRIQRQLSFLQGQFLQDGNLPFTGVLSSHGIDLRCLLRMLLRRLRCAVAVHVPATGDRVFAGGGMISLREALNLMTTRRWPAFVTL
jgi:hypothetical protein